MGGTRIRSQRVYWHWASLSRLDPEISGLAISRITLFDFDLAKASADVPPLLSNALNFR